MATNGLTGAQPRDSSIELSIVVPMFNEEDSIDLFFARVEPVAAAITPDYEIICVDDGSSDSTFARLVEHRMRSANIKVLSLSRNFGKDIALSAGLNYASGNAIVPIDCDLQDPPELMLDMYQRLQEGFDVVFARRAERTTDTWLKRVTAGLFYKVHNSVADVEIPHDTGDFRMFNRDVLEALKTVPEKTRFMKGLFAWVGFRQTSVEYARDARAAGQTKWRYWKLWNFALDGITAGSTLPLRIWTYFGGVIALSAFAYAGFILARTVIHGAEVPGYASLMIVVLMMGGINIIATGILGEYLGRVHIEVRNRPLYIVREAHGLNTQHDASGNSAILPAARAQATNAAAGLVRTSQAASRR
jgi:glycosyltransferase involved in cell wall biosynthesis